MIRRWQSRMSRSSRLLRVLVDGVESSGRWWVEDARGPARRKTRAARFASKIVSDHISTGSVFVLCTLSLYTLSHGQSRFLPFIHPWRFPPFYGRDGHKVPPPPTPPHLTDTAIARPCGMKAEITLARRPSFTTIRAKNSVSSSQHQVSVFEAPGPLAARVSWCPSLYRWESSAP